MDFGRIARQTKLIQLDEWNRLIESHDFLEPIPDRKGINPFTKEDVVFSGEGKAFYIDNGKRSGNISLDDGELLTTGVPLSVCNTIAKQLAAQVFEDDRR